MIYLHHVFIFVNYSTVIPPSPTTSTDTAGSSEAPYVFIPLPDERFWAPVWDDNVEDNTYTSEELSNAGPECVDVEEQLE